MQKFVITKNGELRFGDVKLHKNLLPLFDNTCYGGGFWTISEGGMSIDLYGESYDFGAPDFEQVHKINWEGIGGKPLPLFYYPSYPDKEECKPIYAK